MTAIWVALAVLLALLLLVVLTRRSRSRAGHGAAMISALADSTTTDPGSGAVRSIQTADLTLARSDLLEIWSAENLERLARTYWRFLSQVTLGLVRVRYTERERSVVLLFSPLKLLTFQAPEYELDAERGVVRWRIARGLLVARAGRHGQGHLQIEVRRRPCEVQGRALLHIEVEVASFYPAIAFGISRWLYDATQSRIHVIVTHGFLRSLARLDLAETRVGRLRGARPPRGDPGPGPTSDSPPRGEDRLTLL